MVDIVFRGAGAWGAGVGRNLHVSEFDGNNYAIKLAIEDLIANPVQPNQISGIDVTGNVMTITLEGGAEFGPFTLPIAEFHDRGAWADDTDYVYGDIFTNGTGLYMVLQDHTSAAPFNPAATNGFGALYRTLFDASGLTMTYLDDGYPPGGTDLHTFEVFSVPDLGVYMVLSDHVALSDFNPNAEDDDANPLYKKIFSAIETAVARIQIQYAGALPSDSSLMWKYIQDDTRDLVLPVNFVGCSAHIETAVSSDIEIDFVYAGDIVGTLVFAVGTGLDGDGGQFGTFSGDGATIAPGELLRMTAPDSDGGAVFLTVAILGSYVEP